MSDRCAAAAFLREAVSLRTAPSAPVDVVEAWMQVGRALATSIDAADRELARSIAIFVQEASSATASTVPIRTPETKLIGIDPLR
jgi:hypothetical protein